MAYPKSYPSGSDEKNYLYKVNSQPSENVHLVSNPETIRILLFKECRLRDRQLIFDSHVTHNEEGREKNTSKGEKKNYDEFSYLTEMIFGSTAMKYQDTYYKIHDVSCPDRLIFTQVFSTSNIKQLHIDSHLPFSKKNSTFQSGSSLEECELSASSLSQSSMDSRLDSFLLFRKNNAASRNSTSSTIDSGFSDSSFSSRSSFQPSYGSFTRQKLEPSNAALNICSSFLSDSDSPRNVTAGPHYSKLGLALIIPVSSKIIEKENICIQHITFIESVLWRIRQYVELAINSPRIFLATMMEISSVSASWLSKELNFWTKGHFEDRQRGCERKTKSIREKFCFLNLRKSIFFRKEVNDFHFEKFCRILNELDVKETKFFLSTLLTAVLTQHTGWVASCYLLNKLHLDDSYHAMWKQLTSLYGASGYLTKTSKTVIYGLKDKAELLKIIDFLLYFIRYFKVERGCLERGNISKENKIVDDICNNINTNESQKNVELSLNKKEILKMNKFASDFPQLIEEKEKKYYDVNIKSKHSDTNNVKIKALTKKKTFGQGLFMLNDLDEETNSFRKDESDEKVLFILGDNDKLQNLKKTIFEKNEDIENVSKKIENDGSKKSVKLKVINFPLPEVKSIGNFSEVIPHEFSTENDVLDFYIPDKCLQATNISEDKLKKSLKTDLTHKRCCLFPTQLDENVVILGNADKWEVQVWSSSNGRLIKNISDSAAASSPLVSNMLEVVLQMWQSNMRKEYCTTFMEQRLVEICLKANALSEFLLTTDFCTIETLLATLNLNIVDIPLLMSVGSNINPEILQKYGISYQ